MAEEADIDGESEEFEIGTTREYEVSVFYVAEGEDETDDSDGMVYTVPAVSQRMAEEYAGLRFTMESEGLADNGALAFKTVCKDSDHSLEADYRAEMLDATSFYINCGLSNESIIETLQAALEEMQRSD